MISARQRASATDRWTLRARPAFLYVMYGLLLWSVPLGLVGGIRPDVAAAIIRAMRAYFNALPEPLYALFGTGISATQRRGPGGKPEASSVKRPLRRETTNERGRWRNLQRPIIDMVSGRKCRPTETFLALFSSCDASPAKTQPKVTGNLENRR